MQVTGKGSGLLLQSGTGTASVLLTISSKLVLDGSIALVCLPAVLHDTLMSSGKPVTTQVSTYSSPFLSRVGPPRSATKHSKTMTNEFTLEFANWSSFSRTLFYNRLFSALLSPSHRFYWWYLKPLLELSLSAPECAIYLQLTKTLMLAEFLPTR